MLHILIFISFNKLRNATHLHVEGDEITVGMTSHSNTKQWAKQAIEPFDQNPLEVKALLDVKVDGLFLGFSGHLFYMHIKEKINGTRLSNDNDGVNESAINPLSEEDNKDESVQQDKYGHLRVSELQNFEKISKNSL